MVCELFFCTDDNEKRIRFNRQGSVRTTGRRAWSHNTIRFLIPPSVLLRCTYTGVGRSFCTLPTGKLLPYENNIWKKKKRLILNERTVHTHITPYNAAFCCNLYCVYYGTVIVYLRPTIWKMNGPEKTIVENQWATLSVVGWE